MDWYSLISAATAGMITWIEIERQFSFPKKTIFTVYLLIFFFVAINAGLAFGLFFVIRDIEFFQLQEFPKWVRAFFIGIAYLSLIRQKLITLGSGENQIVFGIEIIYVATKKWFYEKINAFIVEEIYNETVAMTEKYTLEELQRKARGLISANHLLPDDKREEDKKFIQETYEDLNSDEEIRKESIITFIRKKYPEPYKKMVDNTNQKD
jgi:hypothetical protein